MTPAQFKQLGEALYGPRWQTSLARDLVVVTDRTVRRWSEGEHPIPEQARDALWHLCAARVAAINGVVQAIYSKTPTTS